MGYSLPVTYRLLTVVETNFLHIVELCIEVKEARIIGNAVSTMQVEMLVNKARSYLKPDIPGRLCCIKIFSYQTRNNETTASDEFTIPTRLNRSLAFSTPSTEQITTTSLVSHWTRPHKSQPPFWPLTAMRV